MKSKYELLVEALEKRGYFNQDLVDEIVQIYGREQLSIHGVVKSLKDKKTVTFDDWLKINKIELINDGTIKYCGTTFKSLLLVLDMHRKNNSF